MDCENGPSSPNICCNCSNSHPLCSSSRLRRLNILKQHNSKKVFWGHWQTVDGIKKEIISPLVRQCPTEHAQKTVVFMNLLFLHKTWTALLSSMKRFYFVRQTSSHFNIFLNSHSILQFCLWNHLLQHDNMIFPVVCHKGFIDAFYSNCINIGSIGIHFTHNAINVFYLKGKKVTDFHWKRKT